MEEQCVESVCTELPYLPTRLPANEPMMPLTDSSPPPAIVTATTSQPLTADQRPAQALPLPFRTVFISVVRRHQHLLNSAFCSVRFDNGGHTDAAMKLLPLLQ